MALLRVSKKVHNEASHVFWSTNTFDVILTDREAFIDVNYKDADSPDERPSRNYLKHQEDRGPGHGAAEHGRQHWGS